MFTKVIFVTILIVSLEDVIAFPEINDTLGTNLLAPGQPNLFKPITFDAVPTLPSLDVKAPSNATTCTCAVFMSGQFKRGSAEQPTGYPALISELEEAYPCNPIGMKTCVNKCLESIIKHLPNSESIICGTINRDCHKERAHLFVQNCEPVWVNSNLSAGREYCCKDNLSVPCPLL